MQVTRWVGMGLVVLAGCGKATRLDDEGTDSGSTGNVVTSTTGQLLSIGGLTGSATSATTTNGTATGTGGAATSSSGSGDGSGTSTSGSGGAGATTVTGSAGAAGSDPIGHTHSFDEGVESWEAQYMADGVDGIELGWSDGALVANLDFSQITAPEGFAGFGVSVDGLDLSSGTITADVRQVSSGDGAENMAQIYVRTGTNVVAHGPLSPLSELDTWYALSFTLAEPQTVFEDDAGSYDPADVREIGVEFRGSSSAVSTVMFEIDNVSY